MKSNKEMTDAVFARMDTYEQKRTVMRARMRMAAGAAGCLVLLLAGGIFLKNRNAPARTGESTGNTASAEQTAENGTVYETAVNGETVYIHLPGETEPAVTEIAAETGRPGETAPAVTEIAWESGLAPSVTTAVSQSMESAGGTVVGYTSGAEIPQTGTRTTLSVQQGTAVSGASSGLTQTTVSGASGSIMDVCVYLYNRIYHNSNAADSPVAAHRPAGYDRNIGPALALMLSVREQAYAEYLEQFAASDPLPKGAPEYAVLVQKQKGETLPHDADLFSHPDNPAYLKLWFEYDDSVYREDILTAAQITAYAKEGYRVSLIGSGLFPDEVDWNTQIGRYHAAEFYGDGFTGHDNGLCSNPAVIQVFRITEE